ncbi:MAG: hypothetical protein HRT47_03660 [Candidatus Caenarcaniphilales bacterium]|nr:hypothetical protein [Candidatus Caenarcaniphilales bacterium]
MEQERLGSIVSNSLSDLEQKTSDSIEYLDSVIPSENSPNEIQKVSGSGEIQFLTSYEVSNENIVAGNAQATTENWQNESQKYYVQSASERLDFIADYVSDVSFGYLNQLEGNITDIVDSKEFKKNSLKNNNNLVDPSKTDLADFLNTINNNTLFDATTLVTTGDMNLDTGINTTTVNLGANQALENLQNIIHDGDSVYNGSGSGTETQYLLSGGRTMDLFTLDANGRINMSTADQLTAFDEINDFANNIDSSDLGSLTLDEFKQVFLNEQVLRLLNNGNLKVKDDDMLHKIQNNEYENNITQFITDYKAEFGLTGSSDYEVLVNVYLESFDLTSDKYIEDNRSLYDLLSGDQSGTYGDGSLSNVAFSSISDAANSAGAELYDSFARGFDGKTTSSLINAFKDDVTTVSEDYIGNAKDPSKTFDIRDVKYLYEAMLEDPSFAIDPDTIMGDPTQAEQDLINNWNIMKTELNAINGLSLKLDRHESQNGITPYVVPDITDPVEVNNLKNKFENNLFNLDTTTSSLTNFNEKLEVFVRELDMGITNTHKNIYAGQQVEASRINAQFDTKARPAPRADGSIPEDTSIPPLYIGPTVSSLVITALGEELKEKTETLSNQSFVKLDSSYNIVDTSAEGSSSLQEIQAQLGTLSSAFSDPAKAQAVEQAILTDMEKVLEDFFTLPDVQTSYTDLEIAYNDLVDDDTEENRKAYIDAMDSFNKKLLNETNGDGNTLEQAMVLIADNTTMSNNLRNAIDNIDGTLGDGLNFDTELGAISDSISDLRNSFESQFSMDSNTEVSKVEKDLNFYNEIQKNGSSMSAGLVNTFDDLLNPSDISIFTNAEVAAPPSLTGSNVNKLNQIADWLENEVLLSVEEADENNPDDMAFVNFISENSVTKDLLAPHYSTETSVESDIEILRHILNAAGTDDANLNNYMNSSKTLIEDSFDEINAFSELSAQLDMIDELSNPSKGFSDSLLDVAQNISPSLINDLENFANTNTEFTTEQKNDFQNAIDTFNNLNDNFDDIKNATQNVGETDQEFQARVNGMKRDFNDAIDLLSNLNDEKIASDYKDIEDRSVTNLIIDNKSGAKDMSPQELLLTMFILQMFEQSSWEFNVWLNDTSRYS